MTLLDAKLAELPHGSAFPGDVAFDLYETYGFPREVTTEILEERNIELDETGYDAALARAQAVSGSKSSKAALYENLHDFHTAQTRRLSQLAQGLLDRWAGLDDQSEKRRGPLGPGVTFLPRTGARPPRCGTPVQGMRG